MRSTETYSAVVTANDDPDNLGRLRVACAALMGDEDSELPHWVEPVLDWGWFFVPDVGELIEIEITTASSEDEQAGQMSIDNLAPRWRGARYYGNEEGESPTPINEEFFTNYGKRRGFATPGGHTFIFDDTDNDRSITLSWLNADEERSFMTFSKDGSFKVETKTGHVLFFDAANSEFSIIDEHGNAFSSDSNGARVVNGNGTSVDLDGDDVKIDAGTNVTVNCTEAAIAASSKIQLGNTGLVEALILGTTFINNIFNTHTHPTGVGPSGPPSSPAPSSILSSKVFTE